LVQWRSDLVKESPERVSATIAGIDDPHAVRGLAVLLQSERWQCVRLLYVQALSNIGTPDALNLLLDVALTDADADVVQHCLNRLADAQHPLVLKRLLETLHHENNSLVNRAASALVPLKADASVGPLIDALVTRHELVLPNDHRRGTGQVVQFDVQNRDVLSALVELTGIAGFGFDKKAWKQWRYWQNQQDNAREAQTAEFRRAKS
jgi:HEAT repeat protein